MPLSAYLKNTAAWAGYATESKTFVELCAFLSSLGANKHESQQLGYYPLPNDSYAHVTQWYVAGYRGRKIPAVFTADDRDRDRPFVRDSRSANMFIRDEYNPVLGIDYTIKNPNEDIIWLDMLATAFERLGYPTDKTAEMLTLLDYEADYGRGEIAFTKSDRAPSQPFFKPRPSQMLLDNVQTAGILATATHLNAHARRRYMRLDLPVDLLPDLIKPAVPYDYIASVYPKRTNYVTP